MAETYTLLDWQAHTHAETLGVKEWYDQQFDPLEEAIKSLSPQEAHAVWEDAMLFVVANWITDHDSTIPIILREHLYSYLTPKEELGPLVGLRLAKRSNRSDVITVLREFWSKPAETKAACRMKADVTTMMTAEMNLPKDALSLAVEDLVHSVGLLSQANVP